MPTYLNGGGSSVNPACPYCIICGVCSACTVCGYCGLGTLVSAVGTFALTQVTTASGMLVLSQANLED
jgi:hypothetical protein